MADRFLSRCVDLNKRKKKLWLDFQPRLKNLKLSVVTMTTRSGQESLRVRQIDIKVK